MVRFWYALNVNDENNLVSYVAEVIARCADHMDEANRNQLIENFRAKLIEFRFGNKVIFIENQSDDF